MLKLNPQSDDVRRWGRWEVLKSCKWSPGVLGFVKLARQSFLAFATKWGHREKLQSVTQKALTRTQPCWHSALGLLASSTVKNKFLLLVSYSACGILLQQLKQTKTGCPILSLIPIFLKCQGQLSHCRPKDKILFEGIQLWITWEMKNPLVRQIHHSLINLIYTIKFLQVIIP